MAIHGRPHRYLLCGGSLARPARWLVGSGRGIPLRLSHRAGYAKDNTTGKQLRVISLTKTSGQITPSERWLSMSSVLKSSADRSWWLKYCRGKRVWRVLMQSKQSVWRKWASEANLEASFCRCAILFQTNNSATGQVKPGSTSSPERVPVSSNSAQVPSKRRINTVFV